MALDPTAKRIWIEIQKKYCVPVNAIGLKIKSNDEKALSIWKKKGIHMFIREKSESSKKTIRDKQFSF